MFFLVCNKSLFSTNFQGHTDHRSGNALDQCVILNLNPNQLKKSDCPFRPRAVLCHDTPIGRITLETQFTGKIKMVQRHTIPCLKGLIVDKNIPGEQGRGSIMGLPRPLFLKSSIYHKEWAWQANKNATPPIFRI